MKPITPAQLKLIHTLLGQLDLTDQKADMVYSFSNGRTESSRELHLTEAKEVIEYLKGRDASSRIIKAIWYLARQTNIISGNTWEDNKMNAAKLDLFCKERGTVKKPVGEQSLKELKKTQQQFEMIFKRHNQRQANLLNIQKLKSEIRKEARTENYERCAELKRELELLEIR